MNKKQLCKQSVVEAAFALSAETGWQNLSWSALAQACETDLAALHDVFQDKTDILVAFGRMVDAHVLEHAAETPESKREALFDVLMDRFEFINGYRAGLVSVLSSFRLDPKQAVISMPYLCRSMTWMLEAAGFETCGFRGALRVAGLTGLYLKVLRVWVQDETPDLSQTMAALDKDLNRLERWAVNFGL